ncbi:hypothetical protein QQF64_002838 [Cirrhinus molitorella]|uniref:Uncharacterized protein n=1 Tax=Cirrhinus molitorella TaxID=172907 RepID=A0ABR3MRA0_9TELE
MHLVMRTTHLLSPLNRLRCLDCVVFLHSRTTLCPKAIFKQSNVEKSGHLPYVLFGILEVPQASTGFTSFELLFGQKPRGLLDVAKEAWEQQQLAPRRSVVEHVKEMREKIDRVMTLVREHLVHTGPNTGFPTGRSSDGPHSNHCL